MPFGIGGWEPLILLLVAILVFGPKQLPRLARNLGIGVREFKKPLDDFTAPLKDPLGLKGELEPPRKTQDRD
jgi:TatA/E family protein of Tat protein translocase